MKTMIKFVIVLTFFFKHSLFRNGDQSFAAVAFSFCSLFAGSIPRVTFISVGGFIFLGAYEKVRRTLL